VDRNDPKWLEEQNARLAEAFWLASGGAIKGRILLDGSIVGERLDENGETTVTIWIRKPPPNPSD
jgi:hypothetical protein